MKVSDIIEKKLQILDPFFFEIIDQSPEHEGHKAMIEKKKESGAVTESHLHVIIVSKKFDNMPLLERHRLVKSIIKDEILNKLHAFSLKTLSLAEYSKKL